MLCFSLNIFIQFMSWRVRTENPYMIPVNHRSDIMCHTIEQHDKSRVVRLDLFAKF